MTITMVQPLTPWRVLQMAHPTFFELWASLNAVAWGCWLANPLNHTFGNSPAWNALAVLAPELAWGVLMAGLGVLHLVALWRRNLLGRTLACLCMGVLWVIFAIVFFEYMRNGLTWVNYLFMGLGNLWCIARFNGWLRAPWGLT